jgi:hypothetical protein
MSFNYNTLPTSTAYISIPVHPEVWQVVCDGVDFPDEDEQPTSDQLQKIHRNASDLHPHIIGGQGRVPPCGWLGCRQRCVEQPPDFHEGPRPMRKAKIEMLEGKLNRFVMFDDEIDQDMFNHLKKMVNKAKALGSKKWSNRMLTERLM